ncbi:MAG TPA: hypothetical protein VF442_11280, partial [Sphingobium sp.]
GMAVHDSAWEPGVHAKNAFNRKVELTRAVLVNSLSSAALRLRIALIYDPDRRQHKAAGLPSP